MVYIDYEKLEKQTNKETSYEVKVYFMGTNNKI